jgi:predicted metal-binding protein
MRDRAKPRITLHVCVTCRRGEEPLEPREGRSGHRMRLALGDAIGRRDAAGVELVPVECLSGCKRGCTVALSALGKWSYVIADLDPERHAPDILTFAEQYAAHPDGVPVWRERPEIVKRSVLARIPPLPRFDAEQEEAA